MRTWPKIAVVVLLAGLAPIIYTASHSKASRTVTGTAELVARREQQVSVELQVGKAIVKTISSGQIHSYRFKAKKGQYVHVEVEQQGIDIVVSVLGPQDKDLVEMNNRQVDYGQEPLSFTATTDGSYRIAVKATTTSTSSGNYTIKIVEVRTLKAGDMIRIEAERAAADGQRLRMQGKTESYRGALDRYEVALKGWREIGDSYWEATTLTNIGSVCSILGEQQKAMEALNAALSLSKTIKDIAGEWRILNNFGAAYDLLGERKKALDYYSQALSVARRAEDRRSEATTLTNIGNFYGSLGEAKQALDFFNPALSLARAIGNRGIEADILIRIGLSHHLLGHYQTALDSYNLALPLHRAINNNSGEADALMRIGDVYDDLGENQKALEYLNRALPVRRAAGDPGGEGEILSLIGGVYNKIDEKEKALDYYKRAVQLKHAASDKPGEAMALIDVAMIYRNLGEHQKALEYLNQAMPLRREARDPSAEAVVLNLIGSTYRSLGENQKALDCHIKALSLTRGADRGREAETLNDIGSLYYALGEKQKALDFQKQALSLWRAIGRPRFEAYTLRSMGLIQSDLGEKEKSLDSYSQALQLSRAAGDRSGEAATLRWIGDYYRDLGDTRKALNYFHRALPLQRAVGDLSDQAVTLIKLMLLENARQNPSLAIFHGKQAIRIYQQLRSNIQGLEREVQQTFLRSVENWYRRLADLMINQGRLPEAQQVLAMLKEEEYFEFVRRDTQASSLLAVQIKFTIAEAELEKRFAEIASRITEIGSQRASLLALKARSNDQEKQLAELESQLESANQAFQKFLEQLDVELKQSKPGSNDVTTLRETQAMMDTLRELDAVALYTIVGQDKYRVILITPDVQKAYEYSITEASLNKKVYAFREVLQNPHVDPLPQGQELYRILLGPELARDIAQTKTKTIIWSLDGTLRYLPIAALHDGQKYLVESYHNVVFTLASRDHLKDPVSPKWQALGVGVSREREVVDDETKTSFRFPALPGVREELNGIVRQETAGTSGSGVLEGRIILDESFTAEALRSSLRLRGGEQPYKLVHIASHFNFQPGDETKSFLLLGDGTLSLATLKSMSNLFSKVELLTLSACNTATGDSGGGGKEIEGFAVLAQRQGAEAIIATLWPVSDTSTSQLMQQFYRLREAKAGTSKAEALRQAQLALLHGDVKANSSGAADARAKLASAVGTSTARPFSPDPQKPFAHPYYWAPFILIGNWK